MTKNAWANCSACCRRLRPVGCRLRRSFPRPAATRRDRRARARGRGIPRSPPRGFEAALDLADYGPRLRALRSAACTPRRARVGVGFTPMGLYDRDLHAVLGEIAGLRPRPGGCRRDRDRDGRGLDRVGGAALSGLGRGSRGLRAGAGTPVARREARRGERGGLSRGAFADRECQRGRHSRRCPRQSARHRGGATAFDCWSARTTWPCSDAKPRNSQLREAPRTPALPHCSPKQRRVPLQASSLQISSRCRATNASLTRND